MNFKKIKYRSLLIGAGATMMLATSCKDFLDVDIYDNYSEAVLSSKKSYQALSTSLYGGYLWSQFEGKFSWCVNEGIPGVLFNVNDQEGALFLLSIGNDNTILKEGYTSLYSGIIPQCNQVVKTVSTALNEGSIPSDMTEDDMKAVLAEARLFRGYAHFLATEYFGEVPVVWNSESDISQKVTLPRVSRRTVYEACRQDFLYAYMNLPESPSDNWRASKYSAGALLAKLYLTMASCQDPISNAGLTYPYAPEDPDTYINAAEGLTTEIINSGKYSLAKHKDIFSLESRGEPSSETVFALYWSLAKYAEGSAYQSQMAPSSEWSPGSGWGSGKGLTYTLYNSFDESDERKIELCFYVGNGTGNGYTTASGEKAWYGSAYKDMKKAGEVDFGMSGSDFLSQGQHLLNNIKKFVWGVDDTKFHGSGMGVDRRQDIIRLSDIYMMRAEIAMFKANKDVTADNKAGLADINEVLAAHGAPTLSPDTVFKYFDDMEARHPATEKFKFEVTVDDGAGGSAQQSIEVESGVPMYHAEKRVDLVQERRKEFAMEGHAWLDLKRLYYRNAEMAKKFMYQMDRGCTFTNSPEVPEGDAKFETEQGYKRLALVNLCQRALAEKFPDRASQYTEGDPEKKIETDRFIEDNNWYLPIPYTAKNYLQPTVLDLYDDMVAGTYKY